MKQAIIITSIAPPTDAVREFARLAPGQLVVVADAKTPADWQCSGAELISTDDQQDLPYLIAPLLPWNHYARKMIGYLHAIAKGAAQIVDTDDDNRPNPDWAFPPGEGRYRCTAAGTDVVNAYSFFTREPIWPRGFPLDFIRDPAAHPNRATLTKEKVRVGIWQGLADGDPDVDAIYRLTVGDDPFRFDPGEPVVLRPGSVCPFNSQNTWFDQALFPLLYLPAHVTFRFTDILRGWVAQPIMWQAGYRLGYTRATVFQGRNPHDYLADFESEIPAYLNARRVITLAGDAVRDGNSVVDNLACVYAALARAGIVPDEELRLVDAWLADCQKLTSRVDFLSKIDSERLDRTSGSSPHKSATPPLS